MTVKERAKIARKHIGKRVRIRTKTGADLYGTIVKVKGSKLYLKMSSVHPEGNKAHVTFAPLILPLVLFDLLVIVLLDDRRRRRYWL